MNDMSKVIVPKSDQTNADDLLSGPRTIRITKVYVASGEQPVTVSYEGDNGRPWKPCKSMCRLMVAAWGPDSSVYVGRSVTLYLDPTVRWGGLEVGGVRISHMSHIEREMLVALTVTRGKKAPYTVKVLQEKKRASTPAPNPLHVLGYLLESYAIASTAEQVFALDDVRKEMWPKLSHLEKREAKAAAETAMARVTAEQDDFVPDDREPGDDE